MRVCAAVAMIAALCGGRKPDLMVEGAANSIGDVPILGTIRELSGDAYEGRAPGTRGEEKTVAWLSTRLKAMGLLPGNPDGTYRQTVPLFGFTSRPEAAFRRGDDALRPKFPSEFVAMSRHASTETAVTASELVFVGYGIKAPEYRWDDYKGLDARGKTLVMLINDPPLPDRKHPMELDESMFKGRAMTYYGRWTYKYEIAAKLGAAAVLIVHETDAAGYPYGVLSGSFGQEQFELRGSSAGRVAVEGWLSLDTAKALFSLAGKDFYDMKAAALDRGFKPVPLGVAFDARVENTFREIESPNVVAKIPGSDPKRKDEFVVYTAHWDHLGKDDRGIYHGAVDNASGVAAFLEVAAAFQRLPKAPARSILFLATTAEEKGLLGAEYYTLHPLYPLADTVADLNFESLNAWGMTTDLRLNGLDLTTLGRVAEGVAEAQHRELLGDPMPEKGSFFRSDHFPFARAGVPALDLGPGMYVIGEPQGFGRRKREEFIALDYHKPSDEVKQGWDLRGMAQDAQALFRIGYAVAESKSRPEWQRGAQEEFKAAR